MTFLIAVCATIVETEGLNVDVIENIETKLEGLFTGAVVKFECQENYIISNSEKSITECLENGNWNVTFPRCYKRKFLVTK